MVAIMGLLIIGAIAFWYFKMGGQENISHLISGENAFTIAKNGGTTTTAGGNQPITNDDGNISRTDANGNNFSSVRNINTAGSGPGVHGQSIQQQSSNINGVVTKNNKVSSFFDVAKVRPRI